MTIWKKEKRQAFWRNTLLTLNMVPASIEKLCKDVLKVTTLLLNIADSEGVKLAIALTPTKVDDALYAATKMALEKFKDELEQAVDRKARKRVAGKIAAHMVALQDGKAMPDDVYSQCFEKVYEGQKSVIG